MKPSYREALIQFLKFGIVGASNTLISLMIYYIFLWICKDLYMLGNVVGWIVSVANGFFWNNKYVFTDGSFGKCALLKRIAKTYLSYGATFLLSTGLLYLQIEFLEWCPAVCPVINLAITIPLNFILNKFWAFR